MIQNILTFCVKNDLSFVDGSIPSGKLVANDINRNSIYLITPYANAIIYANFQTNLQSDKPTSVLGILVNGDITVSEIIEPSKSYYSLVENWNIYEFKVPSTTLAFISRNRTGKIGINFSIEQRLVPSIKPTYGTYRGEIVVLEQEPTLDGYYIVKALDYSFEDSVEIKTFDLNDILVFNAITNVATKYSAYSNKGSTPTAMYSVDPSLLNDNFETIAPTLTSQIVGQVNENTSDILLILQAIGVSDATLLDFSNRISIAEQDIDDLETNSVYTITEVDTTTIDIDVDRATPNGYEITANLIIDPIKNDLIKNDGIGVYVSHNDIADSVKNSINTNNQLLKDEVKAVVNEVGTTNTWQTLNDINTNINNKVSTHDQSATAHLSLRTLIADLQKEIDRLNAKGRSWGEIDKTYSELVAMGEPIASEYISDYLAVAFGHTPAEIGDLVYTKVSDTEPEYEMEFNGSIWVSNGAYLVSKASNTQMGLVQGDLTYVSVLNGLIQVLKSDYATNVGTTGASYDYATLLGNFTNVMNELADRYEKSETYSNAQIEQRLTDLLGLANLQDVLIGSYTNGQTVLASDLSAYNFVIVLGKDGNNTYTGTFKPSEIVSGNIVSLSSTVYLTRGATNFTITTPTSVKLWGIKLDGINATEISYDGTISGLSSTNVKTAIDELASEKADKTYVDAQDSLKAPITNPSLLGTTTITRTTADATTALSVEKSSGSATGNIAEFKSAGTKVGQIDKTGMFSGGVEQTITNRNKHLPLLGRSNDGAVIARFGTATWNGSAWVADNTSYGFGTSSLQFNAGIGSNGFGTSSLQNNTGANSNGFGYNSLFNNTGATSNGFGGYSLQNNTGIGSNGFGHASMASNTGYNSNGFGGYSLQNNTGAYSSGFGTSSLQNNTGSNSSGFGYNTLYRNQKANNTAVGYNAYGDVFLTNVAGAKTFDYTAIDITLERATIVAHSFGATNEMVNLKYTATTGDAIGGIALNDIFQIKIIDADTIEFINGSQKRNITSQGTGTHTFTPQFAYTNTTSLGANTVPNRDNQVVLGNTAVDTIKMGGTFRTPASPTATGVKGEWCYDANYIYVCTATNEWKRTAITTW